MLKTECGNKKCKTHSQTGSMIHGHMLWLQKVIDAHGNYFKTHDLHLKI